MGRGVVMLFASLWLVACGSPEPAAGPAASVAPASAQAIPCDDGGSGGVLIDGVCL